MHDRRLGHRRFRSCRPWTIDIVNSEPADTLALDGNGGDDVIDMTGLGPDTIQPAPAP